MAIYQTKLIVGNKFLYEFYRDWNLAIRSPMIRKYVSFNNDGNVTILKQSLQYAYINLANDYFSFKFLYGRKNCSIQVNKLDFDTKRNYFYALELINPCSSDSNSIRFCANTKKQCIEYFKKNNYGCKCKWENDNIKPSESYMDIIKYDILKGDDFE